ncbi:thioredoxin family protein [Euzebya sp.]|uniref:thioredoxin family protein n=1 Tax=Euzebya sp. TaxID=1971409 RepID=UPI003511B9B2
MDRLLVLVAVVALATVLAAARTAWDGRVRPTRATASSGARPPGEAADVVAVVQPTTPLVLVELTAPSCAACATARAVLDEVATEHADVSVVALDVADAVDLARRHRVLRAPTTLVVGADGTLWGRVSGVPDATALAELVARARGTASQVAQRA